MSPSTKSIHSCLTLCDPVDCSPPGFSVHGILQARILEWVAISFSRVETQYMGFKSQYEVNCFNCSTRASFPPFMWVHWRRKWHPTPALFSGKSHGCRSLVGYSPWVARESDKTERLHFCFLCGFIKGGVLTAGPPGKSLLYILIQVL